MKKYRSALLLLLCLAMLLSTVHASESVDAAQTSAGLSALGGKAGTLLQNQEDFPAGTSVCDWVAMALALSGSAEDYSAYLSALEAYVENAYAEAGGLDRVKATVYHRISLTVLALGGDPTHFGIAPDGTPIDLIADGTYAFRGESLGAQGLNAWIYALLALDAADVSIPDGAKYPRERICEEILAAQESDGGFGLTDGRSDADVTAMAVQVLAPYRAEYGEAIERALDYLSSVMNENGRFTAYGTESAETSAQVILALCALDIAPESDSRFVRGENDLFSGLNAFRQPDGTYGHTLEDTEGNFLATAQVLLALTAVERLQKGQPHLFDFSSYIGPNQRAAHSITIYIIAALGAAAALAGCIIIAGKRSKHGKSNG